MATEEVKIFFKVEGLDGYITDLDDLKSALGGVTAETKQATTATEQLSKESIDSAEQFERRIKSLEGGVKVLAGSAEFAAGAIGLLGDENSEWFKEVEGNVLNIVALAQGAIDVSEGFSLLAQNTKLAGIAQRAFNIIAKANPYVLLATALLAAGAALYAYYEFMDEEAIPTEEELQKIQEKNQQLTEQNLKALEEAKKAEELRISTLDDLRQKLNEVNDAEDEKNQTTLDGAILTTEAIRQEQERALSLTESFISATLTRTTATYAKLQSLVDQGLNLTEDEQTLFNLYTQREEQEASLLETSNLLNASYSARNEIIARQNYVEMERLDTIAPRQIEVAEGEKQLVATAASVADDLTEIDEERYAKRQQMADKAFSVLGDLMSIFQKDGEKDAEKNFEANKKAAIGQAVINTALAVGGALTAGGNALKLATGAQFVEAGIAAIAGAAQVAAISRTTFNGGGGTTAPSSFGGGATLNYQVGGQEAGGNVTGQFSGGAGGTGGVSQTYVLAGDVTSQQQAEAQIQNLARL